MQQQKNDKTTCLLLALTTIFWGSLYTASKVLLDVIQPFTLLCLRYIIAAIAMKLGSSSRSSVKTPNSSSGSGSAVTAPSYSLWDYEKETARPERKPRPSYEINQYIYSKAQTAADLMREARYEQERAVLAGV